MIAFDGLSMLRVTKPSLLLAHLAARQMTSLVIVFHYVDDTAFAWIALHYRERSVGAKGLDSLRPPVVVVIANLANHNTVVILLDQIDPPVEISVALDLDDSIAFHVFDKVRFPVAVGIDRYLVLIAADAPDPLVGPAVAAAMSDDSVRAPVAGEKCES